MNLTVVDIPAAIKDQQKARERDGSRSLNQAELANGLAHFGEVSLSDDLILRVEVNDRLSLRLDVSKLRRLHDAEWQVCHRRRDTDIHADHSGLGFELELARPVAILGVDGRTVRVLVVVDDFDRVVERVRLENDDDWPENL